ncbi:hypothetical protein L596_013199 [Steinernema carpocapsae]|uniref:BTB domain-containing protein n=1 Tax=Steinernema carpocapsae TaxID=34508 RepID=A0A4U5NZF2_STECR|nr:hypothetical protein L596_013199 [Steinernema carpocapsae]
MPKKGVIPYSFIDEESIRIEIGDFMWCVDAETCADVSGIRPFGIPLLASTASLTTLITRRKRFPWLSNRWAKPIPRKRLAKYLLRSSSPNDAVKFTINEQNLWLSKKVLSANSAVFEALFRNKVGEGAEEIYDLKELTMNLDVQEFLQFIGLVHGLDMPFDVGDLFLSLFQRLRFRVLGRKPPGACGLVPKLFSAAANTFFETLLWKLLLCDRFKLNAVMMDTIDKMEASLVRPIQAECCHDGHDRQDVHRGIEEDLFAIGNFPSPGFAHGAEDLFD